MWARKTKEAQVLSFSIIFGGAVLMRQFFHASIKIYEYWCVTQELERQAAATCKARQMRLETGQVSSLRARVSRRKRKRISAQTDRQKLKGPSINDVTHERGKGGCPKHDAVREVA